MAKWSSAIITDEGRKLMAQVISGESLEFTKMAVSDHKFSSDVVLEKVQTIPNIKLERPVKNIEIINETTVNIFTNIDNKEITEGFDIRILGLYAKKKDGKEILYSITTTERPDFLPAFNGVTFSSVNYRFVTSVGNTDNVVIDITDDSFVSQQQFEDLDDKVETIEDELTSLSDKLEDKASLYHSHYTYDVIDYKQSLPQSVINENNSETLVEIIESIQKLESGGDFHDVAQNSITEDMAPVKFDHGVTLCSQSSLGTFPTINDYGVSITYKGKHSNYAQIFIATSGDIWSRRSTNVGKWNGEWYNSKKSIEEVKDLISTAGKVDSVNGKQGEVVLTGSDLMVSMSWSEKISDVLWDMYTNKADSSSVVTSINDKQGKVSLDAYTLPMNSYSPGWTVKDEFDRRAFSYDVEELQEKTEPYTKPSLYKEDLNDLVTMGRYYVADTAINKPGSGGWFVDVYVANIQNNSQLHKYQVAYKMTGEKRVFARNQFGGSWTEWQRIDGLDKPKEVRTSTIVIANYDSQENSKKGADYVVGKGENASITINKAIKSLEGTGGEVKLMEGKYNLEYGIVINVDNIHLKGIPGATVLVQNTNWRVNPANNSRHIIQARAEEGSSINSTISDLYIKGAKVTNSSGIYCYNSTLVTNCIVENSDDGFYSGDSATVANCTSINSDGDGFYCSNESQAINCTSIGNGSLGFFCVDNARATNCISKGNSRHGFSCGDRAQVSNCISESNDEDGFFCSSDSQTINCFSKDNSDSGYYCTDGALITSCISEKNRNNGFKIASTFRGVCSFNTSKGDKLADGSSSSAVVEYNIVKE